VSTSWEIKPRQRYPPENVSNFDVKKVWFVLRTATPYLFSRKEIQVF
jgi:hypothetical protein